MENSSNNENEVKILVVAARERVDHENCRRRCNQREKHKTYQTNLIFEGKADVNLPQNQLEKLSQS